MTPEEHERMMDLCRKIQTEKDSKKFNILLAELNALLEHKKDRLEESTKP